MAKLKISKVNQVKKLQVQQEKKGIKNIHSIAKDDIYLTRALERIRNEEKRQLHAWSYQAGPKSLKATAELYGGARGPGKTGYYDSMHEDLMGTEKVSYDIETNQASEGMFPVVEKDPSMFARAAKMELELNDELPILATKQMTKVDFQRDVKKIKSVSRLHLQVIRIYQMLRESDDRLTQQGLIIKKYYNAQQMAEKELARVREDYEKKLKDSKTTTAKELSVSVAKTLDALQMALHNLSAVDR